MPYATRQDFESRFGLETLIQLTDREFVGQVDDSVFALAQIDGDAEIDAWLQSRYVIPLTTVPTVLVRISCDLYRYYLQGAQEVEAVTNRYKAAISFLKSLSRGDVNLNLDKNATPVAGTDEVRITAAPNRTFSRDSLRDY
jgi:phage gp36-like protein